MSPGVLGAAGDEAARAFVELGGIVLALAVLARVAAALRISPIPFYLLAGLVVGQGGLIGGRLSSDFLEVGSEIGVLLLLLMLGLEYSAAELRSGLADGLALGGVDLALNALPGLALGLLLGWSFTASLLLAGATYCSSSGIIAKVLGDLDRLGNRETPTILTLLVLEDLAMAAYLPIVGVLLTGAALLSGVVAVAGAAAAATLILVVALRYGEPISVAVANRSDEVVLLTVVGLAFLVGGLAQELSVSAAVGAFIVGIALSTPVQEHAVALVGPLRDLFAATFFLFFAMRIEPAELAPVAVPALVLAVVTAATKALTGWWAAGRAGVGRAGRRRAALTLVARGEFSIVVAGLGVAAGVEADLGPLVAAYVLVLAVAGPVAARFADRPRPAGAPAARPRPAGP